MGRSPPSRYRPIWRGSRLRGSPIPGGIAFLPDGSKAFVCNQSGNSIQPITTATDTAGAALGVPAGPYAIAITPDGHHAYVCCITANEVQPISFF